VIVVTDSGSVLICLPLEYEEKELEKTPLPREVVLTEGVDLPLGKLQKEVSKTPQTVKVDVQVSNGQRRVTTSQSHSEAGPMKKGSGKTFRISQEISY
jgi:hypothetical protein